MEHRNRRIAFGIFLFLLSLYLGSYSGHIHSVDEAYVVAVTASMLFAEPAGAMGLCCSFMEARFFISGLSSVRLF